MNSQKQIGLSKLREFQKHRLYKYVMSFLIVVLATVVQAYIWDYIQPAPFLLFYPAIILACLYGDGNFAILLSCFSYQYFFLSPHMLWPNDFLRMGLFLVSTFMIRKIIRQQTTDKLKAEAAVERLEESEKNLKLEREAREQFVSTLTHDLQTPLTAVKLNLELMKRKKDDPEAVIKSLLKAGTNIVRVETMIQNLLDANRIKAGQKLTLECQDVSINNLIDQTIKDLTAIHGDRFVVKHHEDLTGCWSSEAVRRILENLCNNAIKYGDKSQITINSDIITNGAVISVNNKGNVIPESEIETLFDHFKRAESAEKSSTKGWGLGLTLVKGLAEAHNGNVKVTSDEKNGTTFSVFLNDFKKVN